MAACAAGTFARISPKLGSTSRRSFLSWSRTLTLRSPLPDGATRASTFASAHPIRISSGRGSVSCGACECQHSWTGAMKSFAQTTARRRCRDGRCEARCARRRSGDGGPARALRPRVAGRLARPRWWPDSGNPRRTGSRVVVLPRRRRRAVHIRARARRARNQGTPELVRDRTRRDSSDCAARGAASCERAAAPSRCRSRAAPSDRRGSRS
jgi:hypothetical protein